MYENVTAFKEVNKYAESNTEHAHQVALFMWIARANLELDKLTPADLNRTPMWAVINDVARDVHLAFQPGCIRELKLLFAIPNGGERAPAVAARMKAEGAKAGVSDLMLPVSRRMAHGTIADFGVTPGVIAHGLFLEMKRPEVRGKIGARGKAVITQGAGVIRPDQEQWFVAMRAHCYACESAWTFGEALVKLWSYLHQ